MIRFACPTCRKVYSLPDDQAGRKIGCPSCGQRLQVPIPPNKTVLGEMLPEDGPASEKTRWDAVAPPPRRPAGATPSPPPESPSPRVERPTVKCPSCRQTLSLPQEMVGQTVQCPHCQSTFSTTAGAAAFEAPDDEPAGGTSKADQKYCHDCGALIKAKAVICPKCGVPQPRRDDHPAADYDPAYSEANSNRIAAGLLGVLLGALGIHKFILGYTGAGITMLLVSIFGACLYGLGPLVMGVIGLVEGILYLTKSDSEFHRIYVLNRRPWF